MQRPSPKFWSVQFFVCEIFREMIYLNLYSFVWRRHVCTHPGMCTFNIATGNQRKHLSLRFATKPPIHR